MQKHLVREVAVNPGGRGGRFLLLELTSAGREPPGTRFGKIEPATGLGRGGVAHQWWVREIAEWLAEQGRVVSRSRTRARARGSTCWQPSGAGKRRIAVEVEMTDGHAAAEHRGRTWPPASSTVASLLD